jgi:hypothetical protein
VAVRSTSPSFHPWPPILNPLEGGGSTDPDKNSALAQALRRAREQDVPKENIGKALAKVSQNYHLPLFSSDILHRHPEPRPEERC